MPLSPHTPPGAPAAAPPSLDDAGVQACREGRPEAIDRLFRTFGPMVQSLIGRLVGPTPDLEDLAQTTFLEALGNLHRFRGEASLSTWLCGIAVHVAHHHLRAGKVRRHVPLELVGEDDLHLAAPGDGERPIEAIDARRLAVRLHAALDRLDPRKRIALLLYVVEGRSVEEVAALMNATQTATRSRTFFARRELRRLIAADPELSEWAAGLLNRPPGGAP